MNVNIVVIVIICFSMMVGIRIFLMIIIIMMIINKVLTIALLSHTNHSILTIQSQYNHHPHHVH